MGQVCAAQVEGHPHRAKWSRGPGFSSPNQPDQERATAYRDSSGPDSRSDAHCATIVGDREEPTGESRLRRRARKAWRRIAAPGIRRSGKEIHEEKNDGKGGVTHWIRF